MSAFHPRRTLPKALSYIPPACHHDGGSFDRQQFIGVRLAANLVVTANIGNIRVAVAAKPRRRPCPLCGRPAGIRWLYALPPDCFAIAPLRSAAPAKNPPCRSARGAR